MKPVRVMVFYRPDNNACELVFSAPFGDWQGDRYQCLDALVCELRLLVGTVAELSPDGNSFAVAYARRVECRLNGILDRFVWDGR